MTHRMGGGIRVIGGGGYVGPGDVTPGAASFWGLRAYNAAYATPGNNPAIDICDGAGVNPATINILTNGNLDIATINTWIAAHGSTVKVTKVYDQVGTTHFVEDTGNPDPALTLTGGGSGTQPGIVFTSSGVKRLRTTTHPLNGLSVFTLSGVGIRTSFAGGGYDPFLGDAAASIEFSWGGAANQFDVAIVGVVVGAATDNVLHSLQGVYNGASSATVVDGSVTTGSISGSGADVNIYLGSDSNRSVDGNIHELAMYLSALTTGGGSQTASLYTNQKAYWGTP